MISKFLGVLLVTLSASAYAETYMPISKCQWKEGRTTFEVTVFADVAFFCREKSEYKARLLFGFDTINDGIVRLQGKNLTVEVEDDLIIKFSPYKVGDSESAIITFGETSHTREESHILVCENYNTDMWCGNPEI